MSNNIIDVVTITFNNFDELINTTDSLQNVYGINQIVINGGKCPKTLNYLNSSKIDSLSESDKGISDAFNKGVHKSTNEFLTFLNSGDILLDKNYYLNALEIFNTHPEIDYIYSNIIINHSIHGKMLVQPNHDSTFTKMPFPHPSLIVRKSVFKNIGLFDLDLKIAMDYDFAIRLISNSYKGYYLHSESVVLMDGSGVSSNQGISGQKERIYILRKHDKLGIKSYLYQHNLLLKLYCREFLNKIGVLKVYDKIKNSLISAKPE